MRRDNRTTLCYDSIREGRMTTSGGIVAFTTGFHLMQVSGMIVTSRHAGSLTRTFRQSCTRRVAPRVESLEGRVLLSVAYEDPRNSAISSLVAPGSAIFVEPPASPLEGWSLGEVTVTGPGSLVDVPPAMSELSPPAVTPVIFPLPQSGKIDFSGTLGPSEQLQIFPMPIAPETVAVRVEIQVPETSSSLAERLWILNGSGNVVGHWPIPGPGGTLKVTVHAADQRSVEGLIVGISRDDLGPETPTPGASNYRLQIDRETLLSTYPESPTPADPDQVEADKDADEEREPSGPNRNGPDSNFSPPPGVGRTAWAPLPFLAGGPSAGVLADGRTTTRVGQLEGTVVDLKLIDLAHKTLPDSDQEEFLPDLEPVRKAGGLPLLAMSRPSVLAMSTDAASVVGPVAIVSPVAPEIEAEPSSTVHDAPLERTGASARRPPLILGFSLAAALTFGLLLPDLVSTLTPITPRRPRPFSLRNLRA
jgi:hypothetical protein